MGKFSDTIKQFAVASLLEAEMVRRRIIFTLFSDIIFDTPVDTGRLTANWITSQGTPDLKSIWWNEDERNYKRPERMTHALEASAIALKSLRDNIGDGTRKNTRTFLSNSAKSNRWSEDGPGKPYAFKAEFGFSFYAWNANKGPPPSENVLPTGFSRWSPHGMVLINIGRIGDIVRSSVSRRKLSRGSSTQALTSTNLLT